MTCDQLRGVEGRWAWREEEPGTNGYHRLSAIERQSMVNGSIAVEPINMRILEMILKNIRLN